MSERYAELVKAIKDGSMNEEQATAEMIKLSSPQHGEESLARFFLSSERRRLYPWRAAFEKAMADQKSILQESWEGLRKAFVEQAKNSMFTPTDIFFLNYIIFGNEEERKLLAGVMLRFPNNKDRVALHNWCMGSAQGDSFLDTHGTTLENLNFPLFPMDESLATTNLRLLHEAAQVTGGSGNTAKGPYTPSVFKNNRMDDAPHGGEYWAPVTTRGNASAVNLTEVESVVVSMRSEISRLQQQIRTLQNQNRQNNNRHRNTNNNQPPSYTTDYGNQQGQRRGGLQGNGRGRGYGVRGGRGGNNNPSWTPRGGASAPSHPVDTVEDYEGCF